MNIIIPHSWLKDYLKTLATPEKISDVLSLCSCSVEKLEKTADDFLYHIEITTNRVDMMSVSGVAREAAAALKQFGIKAEFKNDPYQIKKPKTAKTIKELTVKVDQQLCPRFSAVVLKKVSIIKSARIVSERLIKSGIRSIDSIVDISNYIMKALGQPVHTFDYDKIVNHKMILRKSLRGEKITTLDGKTFTLPGDDIVIEDGSGKLIDLCGIMGGLNSAVDKNTKNVLLFIQNYNPLFVRKTSMNLSQRSEAAAIFEKSPDPELVMPALLEACNLAKKNANTAGLSEILDIYPNPYKQKKIQLAPDYVNASIGKTLKNQEIITILKNLGFAVKTNDKCLEISVPSWRAKDISIKQDLVEEVARIYGYFNLPSVVPLGLPTKTQAEAKSFIWETKAKNLLSAWGFTEIYSYSFISEILAKISGVETGKLVKLKNPLSGDYSYMRPTLIPSMLQVLGQNTGNFENINIFELANIYLNQPQNLPIQKLNLDILSAGDNFFKIKGYLEALLKIFNIKFTVKAKQTKKEYFDHAKNLNYIAGEKVIATIAKISKKTLQSLAINIPVTAVEIDFEVLTSLANAFKSIKPLPKYPAIIEDLTFEFPHLAYYQEIVDLIKKVSPLITKVNLKDSFKNKLTFRIYYQHPTQSLTDKEISQTRKSIVNNLESKGLRLVGTLSN